jgi:hypothetical protein
MNVYFSPVEVKLSEFPPPKHQWFLQVHHHPDKIPPLARGKLALYFNQTVSPREAEEFEKMFDRLIEGIAYQED